MFRSTENSIPYENTLQVDSPGLFVFVLDQSASMAEPFAPLPQYRRATALADVANNTLSEILCRCIKSEGQISNRCHIVMVSYGGDSVTIAWEGSLQGRRIVPISEVAANSWETVKIKVQVEDGRGDLIEVESAVMVWVKPVAKGKALMKQALLEVAGIIKEWLPTHQKSFPPLVIHISGGEPDDGFPFKEAQAIRELSTPNGNTLFINVHISSKTNRSLIFPADEASLPSGDPSAHLLFNMSSVIPEQLNERMNNSGIKTLPNARFIILNADAVDIIRLLHFGS